MLRGVWVIILDKGRKDSAYGFKVHRGGPMQKNPVYVEKTTRSKQKKTKEGV